MKDDLVGIEALIEEAKRVHRYKAVYIHVHQDSYANSELGEQDAGEARIYDASANIFDYVRVSGVAEGLYILQ